MGVARMVRAYLKLIHKVPVTSEPTQQEVDDAIEAYKKHMVQKHLYNISDSLLRRVKLDFPDTLASDIFVPVNEQMKGDVTAVDPSNPQLQNLTDMEYFLKRLFARIGVPKARLANEQDVNSKATLIELNTAYGSTIMGNQKVVLAGIMETVKRVLFLEGDIADPDRLESKLILPSPFVKSDKERAEIENTESQLLDRLVARGIISRKQARIYLGQSEQESEETEKQISKENDTGVYDNSQGAAAFAASQLSASDLHSDRDVMNQLLQIKDYVENENGNGHHAQRDLIRR